MKNRTKFTILAMVMIFITLPIQVGLSILGKEMLSDGYIVAWTGAWTCELALLFGIKIKSKD